MNKILVIEDDAMIRTNILEMLEAEDFAAVGAENGKVGLEISRREKPTLIICDIRMPEMNGFDVLKAVRSEPELRGTAFIFLSAAAERGDVRQGMNLGADDYVTKPFTRAELLDAVRARLDRRESVAVSQRRPVTKHAYERAASSPDLGLGTSVVVSDPKMVALYQQAAKAAGSMLSVLVLGETGTGKEVLAHNIHKMSKRSDKPFMALNCAALAETLLEGELFGNERGAYTGATEKRPGLFEAAEGGTVFLDEVGDLPMSIQVKLLRVLEERRVMRVGGRTTIAIDVRFVSATNRDLDALIRQGTFREDLYFRLNGMVLELAPLRERPSEVLPLAAQFIKRVAEQQGVAPPALSEEAADLLVYYSWPGNVRELKNVIERSVVLATSGEIQADDLPAKLQNFVRESSAPPERLGGPSPSSRPPSVPPASPGAAYGAQLASAEVKPEGGLQQWMGEELKRRILSALDRRGGNATKAAEDLGISRRTMVTRIAEYGIPRPRKKPL